MISGGTIMILGAAQAIFFILLIATKKTRARADLFLMTYLLLLIVHLSYYFSMFFFPEEVHIVLGVLGFSLVILHTPFFFLYVKSLASEKKLGLKTVLIHTLPYLFYNAVLLAGLFSDSLSMSPKYGFLGIYKTDFSFFYQSGQLLAIITVAYIIWGFMQLQHYRKRVDNIQSNLMAYKWLRFLVFSFLVYFLAIYFVLIFSLQGQLIEPRKVFYYVSFIIMAYVFVLGFFGIKQREVFTDYLPNEAFQEPTPKYVKSGLTPDAIEQIEGQVKSAMDVDKMFLDPDISLPALAYLLNIKPTYLSQVINQQFQLNFFDFINGYRVEEVKKRIDDENYHHLSLLGIALDCGFKSKSSFNNSFKKHTGTTPSNFKKTISSTSL